MKRISRAIRQEVRERANRRCEYCRLPEAYSPISYQVDHIIPVKRHLGSEAPINLAWTCFNCNRNKETDIAGYDLEDTNELTPLFNPRTQTWDDHFDMDGSVIVAKTAIGRVTLRLLIMNNPDYIDARTFLVEFGLW
jgi:5-methylcytosine-specific restriction endonuclease McrA